MKPHPLNTPIKGGTTRDGPDGEPIYCCPNCGYASDVDGWDGLGMSDGTLFCNGCCREIEFGPEPKASQDSGAGI